MHGTARLQCWSQASSPCDLTCAPTPPTALIILWPRRAPPLPGASPTSSASTASTGIATRLLLQAKAPEPCNPVGGGPAAAVAAAALAACGVAAGDAAGDPPPADAAAGDIAGRQLPRPPAAQGGSASAPALDLVPAACGLEVPAASGFSCTQLQLDVLRRPSSSSYLLRAPEADASLMPVYPLTGGVGRGKGGGA